jgi:uncharacterized membrane protein
MNAYSWLKLVHVLAAIVFLGNIITGLFWKLHADRSRSPAIIAHTFAGITRSDRWFTIPGVLVIIGSGLANAFIAHYAIFRHAWLWGSLLLFGASGIAFVLRVAPLQLKLEALARDGAARGELDWDRYRRLSLTWELWGAFAVVTPLVALALMVIKPV